MLIDTFYDIYILTHEILTTNMCINFDVHNVMYRELCDF